MIRRSFLTTGLLLIVFVSGSTARADGCGDCCGNCGSCGGRARWSSLFACPEPFVTWYAPLPIWWPNYFAYGPRQTPYQVVQYHTSPAESAQLVKARILAINSENPALLPFAPEPLPAPQAGKKQTPTKLP